MVQSICFQCRQKMPLLKTRDTGTYVCACGKKYAYREGIYQFVDFDVFYEGKFTKVRGGVNKRKRIIMKMLSYISLSGSEERTWRKAIRIIKSRKSNKNLNILNIGAGGGHPFLKELGNVVSVDISFESLTTSRGVSDVCYQADACQLPFEEKSFDIVFSSHLLGHIPLDSKQKAIEEIFRVTKPGGFSIHSMECEANNFVYQKARQHHDLYRKYFIDMYGHYGLETPSRGKNRFHQVGFHPVYEKSDFCKGVIRPSGSYKVFFGAKEYYTKDALFFVLALTSKLISCNKIIEEIADIALYPFAQINHLWGEDSVDSVKLIYEKK